ncbi:Uma2 family endonuclease [Aeoliella sp. ICT_H6.2]|uniref:Uma2 family endonuclease n=1 Tax=Aeoliella straminimaris TaxID=2954799 RepID=A0A9X2F9I7_9BACT|nr:Uma2 family endonuclease [Aeoliella straminimaris]MCO6044897.1 Uma2 family endonuclease [Aeoliella straminimaris]
MPTHRSNATAAPKRAAHAQAGVADYWIVNLADGQVEIYRQPKELEYTEKRVLRGKESVTPLALPTVSVTADELLAKSIS